MRKIIGIGLIIAMVMAVATYGILWWTQASHAKQVAQEIIAQINQGVGQELVSYESIEAHGFPTALHVDIVKPHIAGRIDQLLNALAARLPEGTPERDQYIQMAERMPGWLEDITLDGRISFGINAKSNSVKIEYAGETRSKSTLPADTGFELVTKPEGAIQCEVELAGEPGSQQMDAMWDFRKFVQNMIVAPAQNLRSLSCDYPAYTMVQLPDNTPIMRGGASYLKIKNDPLAAPLLRVDFEMAVRDSEILPAADAIIRAYSNALWPDRKSPNYSWAAAGKQNIEVAFTYAGPADFSTDGKDASINFSMPKFNINNALYQNDLRLTFNNDVKGDSRTMTIGVISQGSISEQYDHLLAENLRSLLVEMKQPATVIQTPGLPAMNMPALPPSMQAYSIDDLFRIFEPTVPRLHDLGPIRVVADLAFVGNRDLSQGDMEVRQILLQSKPYAMQFAGKLSLAKVPQSPFPIGSLDFNWNHADVMIDDFVLFMGRMQKAVAKIDPEAAKSFQINEKHANGLKALIEAIGMKDETYPTIMKFSINSDLANGLVINKRKWPEFAMLYEQFTGVALPTFAPEPQAGASPEPVAEAAPEPPPAKKPVAKQPAKSAAKPKATPKKKH